MYPPNKPRHACAQPFCQARRDAGLRGRAFRGFALHLRPGRMLTAQEQCAFYWTCNRKTRLPLLLTAPLTSSVRQMSAPDRPHTVRRLHSRPQNPRGSAARNNALVPHERTSLSAVLKRTLFVHFQTGTLRANCTFFSMRRGSFSRYRLCSTAPVDFSSAQFKV